MTISSYMLAAWGVLAVVMAILWLVARARGNAGIVDVAWAIGTGVTGIWLLYVDDSGNPARRLVLGAMLGAWALRLGWHLYARLSTEPEDGRYTHMRAALGKREDLVMFGFFQIQAAWGLMFALPVWAAGHGVTNGFSALDIAGITLWIVAWLGEWVSDWQLAQFRTNPGNRGQVCRHGLWRYSRHPNYFCEWLLWVGYALMAASGPLWWLAAAGVPLMYLFLTRVTGIPHTEAQALRSRGDAYAAYQRTTSAFFPMPPSNLSQETRS